MAFLTRLSLLFASFILVSCDGGPSGQTDYDSSNPENLPKVSAASANSELPESRAEELDQTISNLEKGMEFQVTREARTGDLDMILESRVIRVLTVYGAPRYFLDRGKESGYTYELFKMFETHINEMEKTGNLKVHVIFLPVARDLLIPALLAGRGDIVAAGLTITPEREQLVDFTNPFAGQVSEILVTGPTAPPLESIEDLSGREVYVRASSSYRSSLDALNTKLSEQGLEKMTLRDVDEHLEDEDILEMVSAGMIPWAVVDDYKAEIWADVLENLTIRSDLVFRSGGQIGYAFRKDSPKLAAVLNDFIKTHRQGSLTGNILINRYLKDYDFAKNALAKDDLDRFNQVVDVFSRYGTEYGIDYLLVAAQGYQESRLDQNVRSAAGAIGIMQLLPTTAADPNVGIPDITAADENIHAGIKYLNFIRNRYFSEPEMDQFNKTMFAMAAYNAGPARVAQLRSKAVQQGYDANLWFDNVEVIAAEVIGRETVEYVSNILKYYVAYNLIIQQELMREEARKRAVED